MSDNRSTPTRSVHPAHVDTGVAPGAAFLGWLTATGAGVILTALVAGVGAVISVTTTEDGQSALDGAVENVIEEPAAIGIVGAVVLAAALFVAYFAGGYVAGRMARVSPVLQGLMVWLWAVVFAVVVGVVTAVGGSASDAFSRADGFPFLPLTAGELTTASIIAVIVVAAVALGGAILGSVAAARTRHGDDAHVTH